MIYRILADAVFVLHAAFIAFAVLGGLLVLRWPRVAWAHLPVVVWGVTVTSIGNVCPLTPLEKQLLELGGEEPYTGGFIAHYLTSVLFPDGQARSMQVVLSVLLLTFTVAVYVRLFRRREKGPLPD